MGKQRGSSFVKGKPTKFTSTVVVAQQCMGVVMPAKSESIRKGKVVKRNAPTNVTPVRSERVTAVQRPVEGTGTSPLWGTVR